MTSKSTLLDEANKKSVVNTRGAISDPIFDPDSPVVYSTGNSLQNLARLAKIIERQDTSNFRIFYILRILLKKLKDGENEYVGN